MNRRTPKATRTDTLFPDTTLFRSVLGGIEAVVGEHCPTDFERPARIQAIAALSHGFFLLTACRFAGNAALISSKTASDSDAALPDAATQAEYRLSRSR